MRLLPLALATLLVGCFGAGAADDAPPDEVQGPAFVAVLQNESDGVVHVLLRVFAPSGQLAHEAAFEAPPGSTEARAAPLAAEGGHRATLQYTYSKGARASADVHEFVVDAASCDGRWHETVRVQRTGDIVSSSASRACHPE